MISVKLNLGSGGTNWPGFVNVDLADNWSGVQPDVIAPLTELPLPDMYCVSSITVLSGTKSRAAHDAGNAELRVKLNLGCGGTNCKSI